MSFGAIAAPEVPPYQLQSLVASVFDAYRPEIIDNDAPPPTSDSLLGFSFTKPAPPKARERKQEVTVTCAQAYGSEIYVGCSDGALLRFGLRTSRDNASECYSLLSSQKVQMAYGANSGMSKGVEEIVVLPSISRALVLCDHTVHFYVLPALDPVPAQNFRPIRGVLALAVDELCLRPGAREDEPVEFSVVKKTTIAQYSLKERLVLQRETSNQGMLVARRAGRTLVAADRENYNVVDLVGQSSTPLLPFDQTGETPSRIKPMMTFLGQSEPIEFLLASASGAGAMGIFVSGHGDPVRGTLEWPTYPASLCLDYPHVLALMRNRTIEVHNVDTQTIVQVVSPLFTSPPTSRPSSPQRAQSSSSSSLDPRRITLCPSGFAVPASQGTDNLRLVSVTLSPSTDNEGEGEELRPKFTLPPSGSLLSSDNLTASSSKQAVNVPRAQSLVISASAPEPGGKTTWALQALVPATLMSQAEALLPPQAQRLEEAVDLAESAQRRMLKTGEESALTSEIQYIYQRAGWQRFAETRWSDAGNYLHAGEMDPRVLVRYFPDLRGALLDNTPFVDVFAGVASCLPTDCSVEDLIAANLVRNYSPHLQPEGTKEANPTVELHKVLYAGAREMLATYLRKWRTRRLFARGTDMKAANTAVNGVVDTVLVKLLAESDDSSSELHTLVEEPNDIVLDEVDEVLRQNGHYSALVKIYQKAGNLSGLLDVWSKLADGEWVDQNVTDPLNLMADSLLKSQDKALVQHWALWMIARNADLGLKLLTSKDSRRNSRSDDLALLQQVSESSPEAGRRYLEYLVLRKRSQDPELHDKLAFACIDQVLQGVADGSTYKLWRAKAGSYVSSSSDMPFLTYFAQTTPESPERQARLKACLFLQGSSLYSPDTILSRLQQQDDPQPRGSDLLKLEHAILYGKLGRHEDAIQQLVRGVGDPVSAEAYCTTGGDVVTGRVAMQVGEMANLRDWASLVTGVAPTLGGGGSSTSASRGIATRILSNANFSTASGSSMKPKAVDEDMRRELSKVLLRVYMNGGEATARRTTRLLNSQAVNLDVIDVIEFVPSDWPLSGMGSFLSRSFRRTQHAKDEGQIIKAISAAQNAEVVEQSYIAIREEGAVIEEAADDEKDEIDEKVGLHEDGGRTVVVPPGAPGTSLGSVAEIRVGGDRDCDEAFTGTAEEHDDAS